MAIIDSIAAGGTSYDLNAQALANPTTIDGVEFDGGEKITHYAVCATDAATADKEASVTGFVLSAGARVSVKFLDGNTAANPTLNVSETGAKAIMAFGTTPAASGAWTAGETVVFVYDGTQWQMISGAMASAGVAGRVKVDATLTQSGQAADAKATGDAINEAQQAAVLDALVVKSASGASVTFEEGADNRPFKALTVDIRPIQSGSGEPSPQNIRPISQVSSLTLTREAETLTFNQMVSNGNFADGATGWREASSKYGSIAVADGVCTYTVGGDQSAVPPTVDEAGIMRSSRSEFSIPAGHKVFLSAIVTSSATKDIALYGLSGPQGDQVAVYVSAEVPDDKTVFISGIVTNTSGSAIIRPKVCWTSVSGLSLGDTFTVQEFMMVDLTLMYGAGNEPSVASDVTAVLRAAAGSSYYPFTTGTVQSKQPDGTWGAYIGNSYLFQFGQSIYGGVLNVLTGVLSVNKIGRVLDGTESWSRVPISGGTTETRFRFRINGIVTYMDIPLVQRGCSHYGNAVITSGTADVGFSAYTSSSAPDAMYIAFRPDLSVIGTVEDWKAYLAAQYAAGTPVTCWWEITDGITTIQLTPAQVTTLLGDNTIYTDNSGDVSASWYCDPTLIYQELTAAILSLGGNI